MTETKTRVVIADDDADYRRLLDKLISSWGYETVVVPNGFEASQILLSEPNTTLAVFDWEMPTMDGVSACRYVRQHRSGDDLFIMMVTVRERPENMVEAFDAGASDMLKKSFHPLELKARLASAKRRIDSRDIQSRSQNRLPNGATEPHLLASTKDRVPPETDSAFSNGWLAPLDLPTNCLAPSLNVRELRFTNGASESDLAAAVQRGDVSPQLLDRVLVCPRCESLPSFRHGCPCCGSGRIDQESLIHHFACAYVGRVEDFETPDGLKCPKCLTPRLTVGADFEYHRGPLRCQDCQWRPTELEIVGHCLRCGFRFPAEQALVKDLVAYHARRVDPLVQLPAPQ